jgi:hypothetical protein
MNYASSAVLLRAGIKNKGELIMDYSKLDNKKLIFVVSLIFLLLIPQR